MSGSPAGRYDSVALSLHWLMALLIVTSFCVGLVMVDLPMSLMRLKLINWHKWAGITILALATARLVWRIGHPPPPLAAAVEAVMPRWQKSLRRAIHGVLYLLFFVVPLCGWAYTSALGVPVVWFGVLPLPDFVAVNKPLAEDVLKPMHVAGAFLLAAAVLLHIAAVLKHQWIDRDGLLWRMWPWGRGAAR